MRKADDTVQNGKHAYVPYTAIRTINGRDNLICFVVDLVPEFR